MRAARLLAALAAVATQALAAPLHAQHPEMAGFQREDEWLTVADFRHVTALAEGDDAAYVGTAAGVEVLPFLSREPATTVTAGDGLPTGVVTALAFDARGGRLWIGTALGLARYDPFRGEVTQDPAGLGTVAVRELRVWSAGGGGATASGSDVEALFALAGGEWYRIEPFSLSAARVPAGRVPPGRGAPDPRALPFLGESVRGDRSGRSERFRVTATQALTGGRVLVGTWGANAWLYEESRLAAEPVVYGLAGQGGGALGWDGERLWFTNDPGSSRPALGRTADVGDVTGIASSSGDLTGWRHHYPGREAALPSDRVHDLAFLNERTFFATDAGLAVFDAEAGAWVRTPSLPELAGLILAVEPAADGVWVGTPGGLVALRWPAEGDAPRVSGRWLEGREVHALAADARALHVGTDLGLWRLAPAGEGRWELRSVRTVGREVRDLALLEDAVVVASERGVEILPLGEGVAESFLVGEGPLDEPPLAVAADRDNVWIGTRRGVTRWDRLRRRWSQYGLADGLPDLPVLDVLIQDARTVWFSTPAGATRHRPRDAAGER